ncbi:cyanoexosortase A [Kovacikia minuta CCNUW1]|uniref:cyanoexosortase A n=1 Tax=Kovacikia minuta TaxID=2931930 RepID=UPI001CCBD055|nr:cyanoexosortase A [Kovacikia minuta]UBF28756.1 cyanoexosortase A [Kovacikia minuta CCNUW1]
MNWIMHLQKPAFWLLAIFAAIAALHLTLFNRANETDLFSISLLFWIAAGSLIWEKRHQLTLESGAFASLLGTGLLAIVLLRSTALPEAGLVLRAQPFVAVLGVALLASGFRGLYQYWKELMIFGSLVLYTLFELLLKSIDLAPLTARISTLLLLYAGFPVKREGVFLRLPTGGVEVYGGCSGIHSILFMLCVAVLFLVMVPLRSPFQKAVCVVVAALLGFLVNSLRVAFLAILNAYSPKEVFEYWHEGSGSMIYAMISVVLFGAFCWLAFLRSPRTTSDPIQGSEAGSQESGVRSQEAGVRNSPKRLSSHRVQEPE